MASDTDALQCGDATGLTTDGLESRPCLSPSSFPNSVWERTCPKKLRFSSSRTRAQSLSHQQSKLRAFHHFDHCRVAPSLRDSGVLRYPRALVGVLSSGERSARP